MFSEQSTFNGFLRVHLSFYKYTGNTLPNTQSARRVEWSLNGSRFICNIYNIFIYKDYVCQKQGHIQGPLWRIHLSLVNSPHKGQWHGALMFSLICTLKNSSINSCESGDLRCHHTHYDEVIIMYRHCSVCFRYWSILTMSFWITPLGQPYNCSRTSIVTLLSYWKMAGIISIKNHNVITTR